MKELQGGNQGSVAARRVAGSLYLGSSFTSNGGPLLWIWFVKPSPSASRQRGALIKMYEPVRVNLGSKK